MSKGIDGCQTPNGLAKAIDHFLKQGGMRRDIYEQGVFKKTVYDDFETRRLYGNYLSQYNKIRKSYPKLPKPQIDTSDTLSALAQLQQLCAVSDSEAGEMINKKNNGTNDDNNIDKILSKLKNHPKLVPIVFLFIILSCFATFLSNWEVVRKFLSNSAHTITAFFYEPKIDIVFVDSDNKQLNILMDPNQSVSIDVEIAVKNRSKINTYNIELKLFHSRNLEVGQRQGHGVVTWINNFIRDDGREFSCQEFYVGDLQEKSDPNSKAIPIKLVITPQKLENLDKRNYELEIHLTADNISSMQLYKLHLTFAQKVPNLSLKNYFVTYKDGACVRLKKMESKK